MRNTERISYCNIILQGSNISICISEVTFTFQFHIAWAAWCLQASVGFNLDTNTSLIIVFTATLIQYYDSTHVLLEIS